MRIIAIAAKNFRTLEDFSISLQPNYCAISGRNNAGKSALISIIQFFLSDSDEDRFNPFYSPISYASDMTQWSSSAEMRVSIELAISKIEDSEMFLFIERFTGIQARTDIASIQMHHVFRKDKQVGPECIVDGTSLDYQASNEILRKLRTSQNLVVHNSTASQRNIFYVRDSYTEVLETTFTAEDRKKISDAQSRLQNSVKRAARLHKEELDELLGRLSDKYQVELSSISGGQSSSKYPLEVKLTDKRVGVALKSWGAGTQNRTKVLMSVLEAIRMRDSSDENNRNTPIFIVEEPESFLHPSAQAEFGQVLNSLADDLAIQIIATTHSPYMLNQSDSAANYLLERRAFRGIPKETHLRDTLGDDWMVPFAENLGIVPKEFQPWKTLFGSHKSRVVLVEGDIDKEYFDYIKDNYSSIYSLPLDVDVVPYGGKDALRNTSILQFMINRFGRVYITFDLDAENDVRKSLERIGLVDGKDFCAVGHPTPGSECIEGLLPAEVKRKVYADNYELVNALGSQDANVRRSAKNNIKSHFLAEFKARKLVLKELADFKKLFDQISSAFIN